MTLKYGFGFDDQPSGDILNALATNTKIRVAGGTQGSATFNPAAQRFNTGLGLRFTAQRAGTGPSIGVTETMLLDIRDDVINQRTIVIGMWVRLNSLQNFNTLFSFSDVMGDCGLGFQFNAAGRLIVGVNTLIEDVSTVAISAGDWHFLEFKTTFAASGGVYTVSAYEVRMDPSSDDPNIILSGTPTVWELDYADIAMFTAPEVGDGGLWSFNPTWTGGVYDIDDIYVLNSVGGAPWNDYLGECLIETFLPDAESSVTGNFTRVGGTGVADSVGILDGTTWYETDQASDEAIFSSTDTLSSVPDTIFGVILSNVVGKDDAGSRTIKGQLLNGSQFDGASVSAPAAFTLHQDIFETDPIGATTWTKSSVEATDWGVEVVS